MIFTFLAKNKGVIVNNLYITYLVAISRWGKKPKRKKRKSNQIQAKSYLAKNEEKIKLHRMTNP